MSFVQQGDINGRPKKKRRMLDPIVPMLPEVIQLVINFRPEPWLSVSKCWCKEALLQLFFNNANNGPHVIKCSSWLGFNDIVCRVLNDDAFNRKSFSNKKGRDCTLLAVQNGHKEVVETLMGLYQKAQKLSIDCFKEACERRHLSVAILFIDKLIKWQLNGLIDSVLRDVLYQCCRDGEVELIEQLLKMYAFDRMQLEHSLECSYQYAERTNEVYNLIYHAWVQGGYPQADIVRRAKEMADHYARYA